MNEIDAAVIECAVAKLGSDGDAVPQGVREAAVAVLLRGESLALAEVLLMRRAQREGDRWSGQIGLPGGHVEEGDEDLIATARRESLEEVGVDPGAADGRVFGPLAPTQARSRGTRLPLYITPIVFHRSDPEEPVLGPEADEAFWLPLELARGGTIDRPYRYESRGDDERGGAAGIIHNLPSWQFEGRTIWGMTHGILAGLFRALSE